MSGSVDLRFSGSVTEVKTFCGLYLSIFTTLDIKTENLKYLY